MIVVNLDPITARHILERAGHSVQSIFHAVIPGQVDGAYIVTPEDGTATVFTEWDIFRMALQLDGTVTPRNIQVVFG